MALHMDEQVQVPACRTANARLAFVSHSNTGALVNARRDFHGELALAQRPAFAMAIRAGVGDHFAGAAAGRAAAFDDEEALLRAHLSHATAGLTGICAMLGLHA